MAQLLKVNDDTTPDELREAITNLNATAKRLPRIIGTPPCLSQWDRQHARIDALLEDLIGR